MNDDVVVGSSVTTPSSPLTVALNMLGSVISTVNVLHGEVRLVSEKYASVTSTTTPNTAEQQTEVHVSGCGQVFKIGD